MPHDSPGILPVAFSPLHERPRLPNATTIIKSSGQPLRQLRAFSADALTPAPFPTDQPEFVGVTEHQHSGQLMTGIALAITWTGSQGQYNFANFTGDY